MLYTYWCRRKTRPSIPDGIAFGRWFARLGVSVGSKSRRHKRPLTMDSKAVEDPPATFVGLLVPAVLTGVATWLSFLGGFHLTATAKGGAPAIGGLWAVISAVLVLHETRRDTWASAGLRVLGTLIGSVVSAAYLAVLPFSPLGMAASVAGTVLVCHALRVDDHARLAGITVAIIMVVSMIDPDVPPIVNASLRFAESFIGTAVAVALSLLWQRSGVIR